MQEGPRSVLHPLLAQKQPIRSEREA